MAPNRRQILEMLADKKITVEEAEKLIAELEEGPAPADTGKRKALPKYLRIKVSSSADDPDGAQDKFNIRVPVTLLRSGMKFASLLPPEAFEQINSALREKGLNFDLRNMQPEDFDKLLEALSNLEIEIHDGQRTVKVYTE